MTRLEVECFDLVKEIFSNLPKNENGNLIYNEQDIETIIKILSEQKESVVFNKDKTPVNSFNALIVIYDGLLSIMEKLKKLKNI